MRIDLVTREYPPEVYGGAGVHVAELTRALRASIDVKVRCFGSPRPEVGTTAYPQMSADGLNPAIATMRTDLAIVPDLAGTDLIHTHTWYANFAGVVGARLLGVPHVLTAHSLEPLRPWKAEQLGGGYAVSSWIEAEAYRSADAIVAVSGAMRDDILRCYPMVEPARVHVIHNGIDVERWSPRTDPAVAERYGIDPSRRSVIFVGRITRQKGLPYFLRAAAELPDDVQLILCAGAPDTDEIMTEVRGLVAELAQRRSGVHWIEDMLPRPELTALLSMATVFVCPSIYEPLGIVNLEAMACGTAVVGTATGGIPEVVMDGQTGRLVPIEQESDGTGRPLHPAEFVADMARVLTEVLADPDRARDYGEAGRLRVETHFTWAAIADRTRALYDSLVGTAAE